MEKGTQVKPATVAGEGKFLIASHQTDGVRVYSSKWGGDEHDVVIASGVEVVVDKEWLSVPSFVRDVQSGLICLRRDDIVPDARRPDVDMAWGLNPSQIGIAHKVCYSAEISPELKSIIQMHKILGPGGMTPTGASVTKSYVKNAHAQLLRATVDLEKRLKNRKPVLKLLATTLSEIEAI